jgi:probable HAF family extracellular repeat protein
MKKASGTFTLHSGWRWCLMCLFGGSVAACGASASDAARAAVTPAATRLAATVVAGGTQGVTAAGTTYTVVNLDPANSAGPAVINASNQVAFTVSRDLNARAGFFNGNTVRAIGTFGGVESFVAALNDAGQVVGAAANADQTRLGFRWSESAGLRALGALGASAVQPTAINRLGQVAGWADNDDPLGFQRAFFWSDTTGVRDLGALGQGATIGEAINDAGMVAGRSLAADDVDHAFVWSAAGGMVDLGVGSGIDSTAHLINSAGQVAGTLRVLTPAGIAYHGFVWSRAAGMTDVGTLGGDYAFLSAMNDAGQVAGVSRLDCGGCFHAVSWTAAGGLADLGTLGGIYSDSFGINRHGEVVGWAETAPTSSSNLHAFLWIRAQGMIDLNQRIPNAPAGLELTSALAISDNGAIVADSTAGLVLLMPGVSGTDAPLVGPMTPEGPVMAGTPVAFAASFSDRNSADRHSATWSWNDGCGPDSVSKVQRPGTVRMSHTFCAPGEYWVTLKITDSGGRSTTVGRTLTVYDPSPASATVAGGGWFMSPRGAYKKEEGQTGRATFGFVAGAANAASLGERKLTLKFHVANLAFESAAYDTVSVAGGRAQYQGSGTVNGAGNYRFMLAAVGSSASATQGRLHMKIWHVDARTKADVVDYDNQGKTGAAAIGSEGSAIAGGGIVIRQ